MTRGYRPEHPFPGLARGLSSQASSNMFPTTQKVPATGRSASCLDDVLTIGPLASHSTAPVGLPATKTPAYRKFCDLIRQGARVLLDLESGQCMLYSCTNGLRMIARLTIRTLSRLLSQGDLVMASRENHWVHYAHPGANLAWFRPES